MLLAYHTAGIIEAGCDEAGRGCLAGPVFAAAVILPEGFSNEILNDSKQLSEKQRYELRELIQEQAIAWAVGKVDNEEIDEINILNASFLAMHRAIAKLKMKPQSLLIDGNRFNNYKKVNHHCIIKGDSIYLSISAASVLAKTYRDDFMLKLHKKHKVYGWENNKGYPTSFHREAIKLHGITPYHRKSFRLFEEEAREI
ncbi:MAG: ribonuclease HII [Bacteroidetes bacterium]|nr:ribonuclease HII [Bacteroidota bacterium]